MNIEARLRRLTGPIAGRSHTIRPRNDQIAVDCLLCMYEKAQKIMQALKGLTEQFPYSSRTECRYRYTRI
nr:hypothetical protein [Bartonella australis]